MQFPGTPEQILRGEVEYSLELFLNELRKDIFETLGSEQAAAAYVYILKVLDLAALGQDAEQIAARYLVGASKATTEVEPTDVNQIEATLDQHQDKLMVLKALYHRMFALKMAAGSKERAYMLFLQERNDLIQPYLG